MDARSARATPCRRDTCRSACFARATRTSRNVSASASTTSGPTRMLPWAAKHGPVRPPAHSKQPLPVNVADPPVASTIPAWRWSRPASSATSRLRFVPSRDQPQAVRAVGHVGVALGRDGTDVSLRPRNDGADGKELRRDRHAPLTGLEVAGDQRERHSMVPPGSISWTTTSPRPRFASSSRRPCGLPIKGGNVP